MKKCNTKYWAGAVAALMAMAISSSATAALLDMPDSPLFLQRSADPNIMILIDSSGSMSNIVPGAPYAEGTHDYDDDSSAGDNCTEIDDADAFASNHEIHLHIADGAPEVFHENGSDTYAIGDVCFEPEGVYRAKLIADNGTTSSSHSSGNDARPSSYLGAYYKGDFLNWYFSGTGNVDANGNPVAWTSQRQKPGQLTRLASAKIAITDLVNSMAFGRVGLAKYDGSNGAEILVAAGQIESNRTALVNAINAMGNGGLTPLAEALADVGRYLMGVNNNPTITLHPGEVNESTATASQVFESSPAFATGVSDAAPMDAFCQKNFVIAITDGQSKNDWEGIDSRLWDYDGDCTGTCDNDGAPGGADSKRDKKTGTGYSYESAGSDYFDDVALFLNDVDLRPDIDDFEGNEVKNCVTTHVIGFADLQVLNDQSLKDAAANGGGGPFLAAADAQQLAASLLSAITDIAEASSSNASVSLNSGYLNSGTQIYQAKFNSANWTGQLLAYPVSDGSGNSTCTVYDPLGPSGDAPGTVCPQVWDAGEQVPAWNARKIFTYSDDHKHGHAFIHSSGSNGLSTDQEDAIDADNATMELMVEYLRGRQSFDAADAAITDDFRIRPRVLGDVIHSDPYFVGEPPFAYDFDGYAAFRASKASRQPMVYIGANDGMLHGFNADTGAEMMAYVPSPVIPNMKEIVAEGYSHKYFVDGSPTVGDVYLLNGWRTVLVGGLRSGGRGYFALNVTDPANFSESDARFESGKLNGMAIWEFTNLDDVDLGYSYSQPSIVRLDHDNDATTDPKWAVVVGNGYNNSESFVDRAGNTVAGDGEAHLYILFMDALGNGSGSNRDWTIGVDYLKVSTGIGNTTTPNGLSTPAPVDTDGDGIADRIYAGDLYGNLWRFEPSGTSWGTSFSGQPLFTTASPSTGNPAQPITTRPEVGRHPGKVLSDADANDGDSSNDTWLDTYMVYFGTGRYIDAADNDPDTDNDGLGDDHPTQTFYGIWDKYPDVLTAFTRSNLQSQAIVEETTTTGSSCTLSDDCYRVTESNTVEYNGSPAELGWYMDLVNTQTSNNGVNHGERQVSRSLLRGNRIIFTTLVPNAIPCDFGGTGWLMELDALSGSQLSSPPFDLNNDNEFDNDDRLDTDSDGDNDTTPSGRRSKVGIVPRPTILSVAGEEYEFKYLSGSKGEIDRVVESTGGRFGRLSWRELRTQ